MYSHAIVYSAPGHDDGLTDEEARALTERGVVITRCASQARKHLFDTRDRFISVLVVPDEPCSESIGLLRGCGSHLSALRELQVLVCRSPGTRLQALAHESGIRCFWRPESLAQRLLSWLSLEVESQRWQEPLPFDLGVAVARREWSRIEPTLENLTAGSVHDPRLAYILGHYHLGTGTPEKAEVAFAQCLDLNPLFPPALSFLARAKLGAGKPAEARALLERLEILDGANPERKVFLAAACSDLDSWLEAEDHVREASRIEAGHPLVLQMKARILLHDGDFDYACSLLEKCQEVDGYFVARFNEAGIRLSHEGELAAAVGLYRTVWAIAPQALRFKLSFNLAITFKRAQRFEEAFTHAQRALREAPSSMEKKVKLFVEGLAREGKCARSA